jgi:uncharacterized membrane protein
VASYYEARSLLLIIFFAEALAVFVVLARLGPSTGDTTLLILVGSLSLSLLLSTAMNSNNLAGWDIHEEFYLFEQVLRTGTWTAQNTIPVVLYNTAISISILPSMLTLVSALDGVLVFRLIYPALFAITPVILYKFYRTILDPKSAFLAVFLFMSYPTFYVEMIQLGRQEIAELLLALMLLNFFSSETAGKRARAAIAVMLTLGIVTAHYSLACVYLLLVGFSFLSSSISRRVIGLTSSTAVVLSLAIAFFWYTIAAGGSAVTSLSNFASFVIRGLVQDFFSASARPIEVLQAAGLGSVIPGFLHEVNRTTLYLVQLILVFGFIALLRKTKSLAERKMLPLMAVAFALLGSAVILPYFAGALNLSRFYHIALLFISPCFAYGTKQLYASLRRACTWISRDTARIRLLFSTRWVLAATILFLYFLFTSGWVWAVAMDRPTSTLFDGQRMLSSSDPQLWQAYFERYTTSSDVYAVRWMNLYLSKSSALCADYISRYHVLTSYGERPPGTTVSLLGCDLEQSYVYLNALNTLYGIGTVYAGSASYSISAISTKLYTENRIYSNGAAGISM